MEGAAWCGDAENCTRWWGWRSTLVDAGEEPPGFQAVAGYFNRSLKTNPMQGWNYVFIRYCDGRSFAGSVSEPQPASRVEPNTKEASSVSVWLRGRPS